MTQRGGAAGGRGIDPNIFNSVGSLMVGQGPGSYAELPPGADGTYLRRNAGLALGAEWVGAVSAYANRINYDDTIVNDGVTDVSTDVENWLRAGIGKTTWTRGGGLYRITRKLTVPGAWGFYDLSNMSFLLDGQVTTGTAAVVGIEMTNTPEAAFAISALSTTTMTASNGETIVVTDLTSSSGNPPYKTGDILFVESTLAGDKLPDGDANSRPTQWFSVRSVAANVVRVNGAPMDQMTPGATLTMKRIPKNPLSVMGPAVDTSDTMFAATAYVSAQPVLLVQDYIRPRVNYMRIARALAVGIEDRRNMGAEYHDNTVDYLLNDITSGGGTANMVGYAYNVAGSHYTEIKGGHARQCRHAVSSNSGNSGRGRVVATRVENFTVVGNDQSGFDSHGQHIGMEYVNCHVRDSYNGWGLRGRNHRLIGCSAERCSAGELYIFSTAGIQTNGHEIVGMRIVNNRGNAVLIQPVAAETIPVRIKDLTVIIENGLAGTNPDLIRADLSVVDFENLTIQFEGSVPATTDIFELRAATVRVRNMAMDFRRCTNVTAASIRPVNGDVPSGASKFQLSGVWDVATRRADGTGMGATFSTVVNQWFTGTTLTHQVDHILYDDPPAAASTGVSGSYVKQRAWSSNGADTTVTVP